MKQSSSYCSFCLFMPIRKISKNTDLRKFQVCGHYLHNIPVEAVYLVAVVVVCFSSRKTIKNTKIKKIEFTRLLSR